jgi:hypothetical protein
VTIDMAVAMTVTVTTDDMRTTTTSATYLLH